MRQRRTAAAADELRVACFGLMDSPPLLMECLVSLANAQAGAGRNEDLALTLARVLEVEGKFPVYGTLNFDPRFKAEFEALLVKVLSREALSAVPEFERLVPGAKPRPPAAPAPAAVTTAPAAPAEAAPRPNAGGAPEPGAAAAPPGRGAESAAQAPAPVAPVAPAPPAAPAGPSEEEALASARRLVGERKYGEATAVVEAALAAAPGSRALKKQHLELLVLQKLWAAAAVDVKALAPFAEGEETSMFYAAVALHEVGLREDAKSLMQRAIGKVARSPFVDYYATRITGPSR